MFIDTVSLTVQAGNGGNGCDSFYRRPDRKVVPNGGDGGKGGDVIVRADNNAPPIGNLRFKQKLIAESGTSGGSTKKRGKNGDNLVILVPPGTRLFDRERNFLIRDLVHIGDEVVVVPGGKGGGGNQGGKEATQGQKGTALVLEFSILLVADIFLVGLPNSGKTKLLNVLTRSQAKEESYAFSTKSPEIAMFAVSDYEQITLCELPSLYSNSHEGRGMGADFIKHLERAHLVLYVVDPVSQFAADPDEGLKILREEVRLQREDFLKIPSAVVVNKMDLPEARAKFDPAKFKPGMPSFPVSAQTGEGMQALKDFFIQQMVEKGHLHA